MINRAQLRAGDSFVDAGCGTGRDALLAMNRLQALAAAQCGAATIRVYRVWAAPLWGRVGLVRVAITVSGGQEAALACAANAVAGPQFRNALLVAVEAALAKAALVGLFAFLSGPLVIIVGAAVGGTLFCLGCCGYVLRKPPCSTSGGKVGAEK